MHRKRLALVLSAVSAAIALTVLIMLHAGVQTVRQEQQQSIPIPSSLAGYPLAWSKSGRQAVQEISKMHWESIHVEDAAIGVYGSTSNPAFILWVAKVENACTLAEKMAEKMRMFETELPYTAPQEFKHEDVTFYVSIDKRDGSLHVFWCQDSYVIWLRAATKEALGQAIRQLIDFYRR